MDEDIKKEETRTIESEMKRAFIDYSMSVIMSRALPDVRDGLKPVHRRILYSMNELGLTHEKAYKKSARITGDCLGKYHPHGDQAVYDSLVRMAQEFSLRYPLVDGQGNFGCFTKDTKVALTDGRDLSFEELIEENKKGIKNYTYTIDKNGTVEISEIKNPRLTKKNQKILKIILDNNSEIKCTFDHKFMLRDGTYEEAQCLKSRDSLMPLYLRLSTEKDKHKPVLQGYQLIYQPKTNSWTPVHSLSDEWNLKNNVYKKLDLAVVKLNHKVKDVVLLNKREDVYDITIEKTHNFALAGGVFVHNSVDGDRAASMRYTEARMAKITRLMLQDIEKDTVEWKDNFDGSLKEPEVLPAVIPNLLINGASGIAVGMATNMAPHNITEIVDGVIHIIDNPDISTTELMEIVKGPDFPTGGIIYGRGGILNAHSTGRGLVRVRARTEIEERDKRKRIIVTEIPYQVNKSNLLKNIAELVKNKKIEGISDLRDESDRKGMRIVIELKRDAIEDVVLNHLFRHTDLQSTFGILNLAIVKGEPKVLTIKEMMQHFIEYRLEIITRRTEFLLAKAKDKMHILEGVMIALKNIDEVIKIIRASKQAEEAKNRLMERFSLSEKQTKAILDMRLQKLTGMEIEAVEKDYNETQKLIEGLEELLSDKQNILNEIKRELLEIKEKFGDERRTEIVEGEIDIDMEDLIPEQEVVITITETGYIKRIPTETYRTQRRGGKGLIGMRTKEEDVLVDSFITSTHDYIMFFTNHGKTFWLKGYKIPEGDRYAKGKAIINLLPRLEEGEYVETAIPIHEFDDEHYLVFSTKNGIVKKTVLSAYSNIRVNGIKAINLDEDDELIGIKLSDGDQTIMISSSNGQACRFSEKEIRPMGRVTRGVIGIRLKSKDDAVVSMAVVSEEGSLLTITENGFGKRSPIQEYRHTHRGSKGVRTIVTNERNGKVLFVNEVTDEQEIILTTKLGMNVRIPVKDIRSQGRNTMGVRIMRLNEKDKVVSVTQVMSEDDEIDEGNATGTDENNESDGRKNDESVQEQGDSDTEDENTTNAEENEDT